MDSVSITGDKRSRQSRHRLSPSTEIYIYRRGKISWRRKSLGGDGDGFSSSATEMPQFPNRCRSGLGERRVSPESPRECPNSRTGALDLVNPGVVTHAPGALFVRTTQPPPCAIRRRNKAHRAPQVPFLSLATRIRVGRGSRRCAKCRSVCMCGGGCCTASLVLLPAHASFDANPPSLAGDFA